MDIYKVVSATTEEAFNMKVNSLLEDGYTLNGTLVVSQVHFNSNVKTLYSQSMVKIKKRLKVRRLR
jgi:hypothetical protein